MYNVCVCVINHCYIAGPRFRYSLAHPHGEKNLFIFNIIMLTVDIKIVIDFGKMRKYLTEISKVLDAHNISLLSGTLLN